MTKMTKSILIVDDDPAVLQSYGRLLARLGHEITLVEECARLRREPALVRGADLLILDYRMPCENGLDFLAALRNQAGEATGRRGADLPGVLLISAFLTQELQARARDLGVLDVLEKPVDPLRLIARVRQALGETDDERPAAAGPRRTRSRP